MWLPSSWTRGTMPRPSFSSFWLPGVDYLMLTIRGSVQLLSRKMSLCLSGISFAPTVVYRKGNRWLRLSICCPHYGNSPLQKGGVVAGTLRQLVLVGWCATTQPPPAALQCQAATSMSRYNFHV
ncbi:hypothetical protein JG687_00017460 [Phytophthora cactorum]|uniref:Uncharacterized protein n=1 Tax=Phytophthora cactorum TaxID=29920 RepID=A0A8T1TS12_9STRA|nr:hypothetical protein JG687_00017460 [Phytophthora cactorum]